MEIAQDTPAFEMLQTDVYRWAYRILGSHHDAADVAQDVFIRWRFPSADSTAEHPRNPRAWLRTVTVNRSLELIRRRRGGTIDGRLTEAVDDRPPAATDREDLRDDLASALEELSERQRVVLVAKVFDGLTFAQVANECGCSVPTAKTHYLRALTILRDRLDPRWGPEGSEQ